MGRMTRRLTAGGGALLGCLALAALVTGGATARSASRYALRKVATADRPVGLYVAPGSPTLFVVEQTGRIRPLSGSKLGAPVLDVSEDVSTGAEQGLLGVAWSRTGDRLYVDLTNRDGDTEIREYAWKEGRADASTERLVLMVDQPYQNHNGGQLVVDRQGLLWIGMGDGGSSGDPQKRAQNPKQLLGKILRIDPAANGSAPYSIPVDNPYADGAGGAPEVWAIGLRNPWRFTIDADTQRLIVGDVGQGAWEEIDVLPLDEPGVNLGWSKREGRHAFEGGARPPGAVEPVYEYSHSLGCSVTGGVVYRGKALSELRGDYLFADYCRGRIGALRPGLTSWAYRPLGVTLTQLTSFGVDSDGEVWVTSGAGSVSKLVRR